MYIPGYVKVIKPFLMGETLKLYAFKLCIDDSLRTDFIVCI